MKRSLPIVPMALVIISVSLVLLLVALAIWPPAKMLPPRSAATADASIATIHPPFAPPQIEGFSALQERPPFTPTRRHAPAPDTATAETNAEPPPDAALLGIIASEKGRIAVLRLSGSGEVMNLSSGDDIQGWKIVEIEDEHLIFAKGDKRHEIWLDGAEERAEAGQTGVVQLQAPDE